MSQANEDASLNKLDSRIGCAQRSFIRNECKDAARARDGEFSHPGRRRPSRWRRLAAHPDEQHWGLLKPESVLGRVWFHPALPWPAAPWRLLDAALREEEGQNKASLLCLGVLSQKGRPVLRKPLSEIAAPQVWTTFLLKTEATAQARAPAYHWEPPCCCVLAWTLPQPGKAAGSRETWHWFAVYVFEAV